MSKRLLYYPFILPICWIWGNINRIYSFFDDEIYWLTGMHLFFGGLIGFFNFIVYGFTDQVH